MSRIEQILEKAEREGNVRFASFAPQPVAVPASAAVPAVAPPAPQPAAAPRRAIRDVVLNPRLLSSMQRGTTAEQYGALRTRIVHHRAGTPVNVVLVTSPGRGEGKSLTAANLALAIARVPSQSVCLVDADLRWPQLQSYFGLPEGPDLNDVLIGRATLEETLISLPDLNLTVLPSRPSASHPAELLGTTAMRRTVDQLRTRFEYVVVDAPAVTPLADVGILTPLADSIVLVVRAGITSKPAVQDAVASLDPSKLLGVVMNDTGRDD